MSCSLGVAGDAEDFVVVALAHASRHLDLRRTQQALADAVAAAHFGGDLAVATAVRPARPRRASCHDGIEVLPDARRAARRRVAAARRAAGDGSARRPAHASPGVPAAARRARARSRRRPAADRGSDRSTRPRSARAARAPCACGSCRTRRSCAAGDRASSSRSRRSAASSSSAAESRRASRRHSTRDQVSTSDVDYMVLRAAASAPATRCRRPRSRADTACASGR